MFEGKVCSRQSAVRRGGSVGNMHLSGLLTHYLYFIFCSIYLWIFYSLTIINNIESNDIEISGKFLRQIW